MAEKVVKLIAKTKVFVPDHGEHGTYYEPGDEFELPADRAHKAVDLGVAEFAPGSDKPKTTKSGGQQ